MPRIMTLRTKKPPKGFEIIEERLKKFQSQMRDVENESHHGQRKVEGVWKIFKVNHQRSRFIYELYYKKKEISKDLYNYLLKQKYADKNLIAKWKKNGYEKLCCILCIQAQSHNFGTVCLCRVPKSKLKEGRLVQCNHCGCRGCATGD